MNRFAIQCASAVLMLCVASGIVSAAKVPVKKPATTNKATMGTTQLKSNYNDPNFGETFTLGKAQPINITVKSAEYTVDQIRIGNNVLIPNANEKYLVLHYTLHNPNQKDWGLSWNTVEIFGVDANDQNWRFAGDVGIEGSGEPCHMTLKPGQKTNAYTFIKLPASGALPKLVIQSRDRLVLRYNLLKKDAKGNFVNKVKPLPAQIADPTDATGGTALEKVPAEIGVYYPISMLDAKLDGVAFSDAPIKGKAPKAGQRYLVLNVTARNDSSRSLAYSWSSVQPKLTDQDGGDIRWNGDVLFGSRDEAAKGNLEPGQEFRVRMYFIVPQDLPLKSVSLQSGTSRAYVYDLTNLK